jgi:nucleotide-binding universal stress UspA family protein
MHRSAERPDDVGDALLGLSRALGADLLVMGCYGHSRAREWVLGGATRSVLGSMHLPVLLVH